jgi:hypothetical protein
LQQVEVVVAAGLPSWTAARPNRVNMRVGTSAPAQGPLPNGRGAAYV